MQEHLVICPLKKITYLFTYLITWQSISLQKNYLIHSKQQQGDKNVTTEAEQSKICKIYTKDANLKE